MSRRSIWVVLIAVVLILSACGGGEETTDNTLTIYSGRSEELVAPLIEQFEADTGIDVEVRYGASAGMAATILEEGDNSPADVFFSQDAGALGALAKEGRLTELPDDILNRVDLRFRDPASLWVGVSGRARVVAYNTDNLSPEDLPDSILGFTDPKWQGRIGWPPTNGSFQSFVTGMRAVSGDEATRDWLEGIVANDPVVYPKNSVALEGVASGEVDVAFINHYYLFRALAEQGEGYGADIYFLPGGDPGALVNVAGAGIVSSTDKQDLAETFIAYLLSEDAQRYFSETTYEYPLIDGVDADPRLPALDEIETPTIDLSDLDDLEGTLLLLQETGALE